MDGLRWNEFEVSEFFYHNSAPFDLEDDEGRIYRADDGKLAAEVIVLPVRAVVCFTILDAHQGSIVVDLAIHPRTELTTRRTGSTEYLYCHECIVLPGIRGYIEPRWHMYFSYVRQAGPIVSVRFTRMPHIGIQFLDVEHSNRAI